MKKDDTIVIVGGDMNCEVARRVEGVTGRHSMHDEPDERGKHVQRVMRRLGYRMVSSDHKKAGRGASANHIISHQASKRNQINHIWMKREHAALAVRVTPRSIS